MSPVYITAGAQLASEWGFQLLEGRTYCLSLPSRGPDVLHSLKSAWRPQQPYCAKSVVHRRPALSSGMAVRAPIHTGRLLSSVPARQPGRLWIQLVPAVKDLKDLVPDSKTLGKSTRNGFGSRPHPLSAQDVDQETVPAS